MTCVRTPTSVSPQWALPCQPSLVDRSAPPSVRCLWITTVPGLCWPDPDRASPFQEMPGVRAENLGHHGREANETGFSGYQCGWRCDFRTCGQSRARFASRRRQAARPGPRFRGLRVCMSKRYLSPTPGVDRHITAIPRVPRRTQQACSHSKIPWIPGRRIDNRRDVERSLARSERVARCFCPSAC